MKPVVSTQYTKRFALRYDDFPEFVSTPHLQQTETCNRMRTLSAPFVLALVLVTCFSIIAIASTGVTETTSKRSASQLYGKHCISCHGRDGRAQTKKAKFNHARDISDAKWQDDVSDERIYNSIMNGRNVRGNMPAFSNKLSDEEADSLVTFVRQLRK